MADQNSNPSRFTSSRIELFYSYAHADEEFKILLDKHLASLKKEGVISAWHDRMIDAGDEWEAEIRDHLDSSRVILLLVSADFLASPYCFDVELAHAIKRHDRGDARVIPVILRACDWQNAPFAKLQVLPKDGRAVASWKDRDEACTDIARGIRSAVTKLRGPRDSSEADASEPEREPAGNFAATLGATGIARVGWRDVVPFAALSLAGFLCVAGLLTLMTWKPEWLPAVHLTSSFYYIVLLTLGLAAATFLFRVFRCYARYTGKVLRTHLKPVWLIVAGAILVAARVFLPRTESLVGHVQDTAGHPVCSAVVGVEESHANVDADGHFSLEVRRGSPPDGVAGEISAPGFETWRGKLIPKGAEAAVILKRIP